MAGPPPGYGGAGGARSRRSGRGGPTTTTRPGGSGLPPGFGGASGGVPSKGAKIQAAKVRKAQQLVERFDGGGGGIGGVFEDFGNLVSAVPSSLVGLAGAGFKEATSQPTIFSPDFRGNRIPNPGMNLYRGFTGEASEREAQENPITVTQGQSFRRTYEDIKDPGRLVDAYNEGRLVSTLVEDTANVAAVGGIGAKALDAGVGGAYTRAAAARAEATAAERVVGTAQREATRAAEQLAQREAAVQRVAAEVQELSKNRKNPAFRAARSRLQQLESDLVGVRAEAERTASNLTNAQGVADRATTMSEALAKQGPLYRAWRISRAANTWGNQGAAAPAKPFELAFKTMPKLAADLFGTPAVKVALKNFDERIGMGEFLRSRRQTREFSGQARARVDAPADAQAARAARAFDAIDNLTGGDDLLWRASQARATGLAAGIADQVRILGDTPALDQLVDEKIAAAADHFKYDPRALRLALDAELGTTVDPLSGQRRVNPALIDEATLDLFDKINAIFQRDVLDPLEQQYLDPKFAGRKRYRTTEGQQAQAEHNVSGETLAPSALADLDRRYVDYAEKTIRQARKLAKLGAKRAEALGIEFGSGGAEAEAAAAAAAVAGLGGRGALGKLTEYGRTQQAAGRLSVAQSAAERFRTLRDSIPANVSDETVRRLSDAVERVREATDRLNRVVDGGQPTAAGQLEGVGGDVAAIKGEVRQVRASIASAVNEELATLTDQVPEQIPFVPGDISELHDAVHGELGGVNFDLGRTMEQHKGIGRAAWERMSTAERFKWAYEKLWRRVEKNTRLKGVLRKVEGRDLDVMAERYAAGNLSEFAGGLDDLAREFTDGDVQRFLDNVVRRGRLDQVARALKGNKWDADLVDQLRSSLFESEELRAMLDDPVVEHALQGKLDDAAEAVMAARADQAATPLELPDAARFADEFENMGLDEMSDDVAVFGAIERASDPDTAAALYDRWQAAGGTTEQLLDGIDDLSQGRQPWSTEGQPEARPAAAQAEGGMAALQDQQAAMTEISQVLGEAGGQAARSRAGVDAGILSGQATQAEKVAARAGEARAAAVEGLTGVGARKGVKAGRKLERYNRVMRDLGVKLNELENMPQWFDDELEKLHGDITNAPARTRPALAMAKEFTGQLIELRASLEKGLGDYDPRTRAEMLGTVDRALNASVKDIRDIFNEHVIGPGGELTKLPPKFETQYRPGGQPLRRQEQLVGKARVSQGRRDPKNVKAREENVKVAGKLATSTDEMRVVVRQRIETNVRNRAAHLLTDTYAKHAEAVLGEDDLSGWTGEEIAAAMKERGYAPWDAERFNKISVEDIGPGTEWLPTNIADAAISYWGKEGLSGFEKNMRRFYDKPITWWKHAVLALRPAWHVNNMISNALMAMVGGGMDPLTYALRIRQANALLDLPEAQRAAAIPETIVKSGPLAERRTARARARAPKRLAKLERRIDELSPELVESLGGMDELAPPNRLVERGEGASLAVEGETSPLGERGRLGRTIQRSYELNGAVDDMNRLAVFIDQAERKLTDRDLLNMQAQHPELLGLSKSQLRTEGAVRISLKVAGDFLRLTPVERQVFRRIFPFYVWMRHITGLSLRLAVNSPARVAWTLHLAQLYGVPMDYGLTNTYPIGEGDQVVQLPGISPFGDTSSVADATDLAFNLTPGIKVPAGILGFNMGKGPLRGFGEPQGYGGSPGAQPLVNPVDGTLRLGELAALLGNQFPQVRVLRGLDDSTRYGRPVMRYPLGEVRRTSKTDGGGVIPSGEPMLGPLARYLGLPYIRKPNLFEREDAKRAAKDLAKPGPG